MYVCSIEMYFAGSVRDIGKKQTDECILIGLLCRSNDRT